ncbi:hypothetical protein [Enterococcus faecalis]|uniref:hypothetical protein n=1 Tax=Enterococcus faecalis TaxID=1351 RepID=UPI001E38A10A|nr:hypothetical protein [Enterococcus faecalis]MCD5032909.1 hypothetical protein [Enterococcus faecalis]MDQ6109941.1 hypothetical protein [Enterococcus faecalis]MDQ6186286.1 hypothetical protein [Enterococcus faecalis]MDQ6225636.1 hypothetical protein [Enterococcus faecalis]
MSKVIQFPKKETKQDLNNQDLLSKVFDRRSKRNGIDYNKLYFGTQIERKVEKQKQLQIQKTEAEANWFMEG